VSYLRKFVVGFIAGLVSMFTVEGLILLGYAGRGYFALGGEWMLILIGIPGLLIAGYKLRQCIDQERKQRAQKKNKRKIAAAQIKDYLELKRYINGGESTWMQKSS
jgi:hypothetical protein